MNRSFLTAGAFVRAVRYGLIFLTNGRLFLSFFRILLLLILFDSDHLLVLLGSRLKFFHSIFAPIDSTERTSNILGICNLMFHPLFHTLSMNIPAALEFTVGEVVALVHLHKADTTCFVDLQLHPLNFISLQLFTFTDEQIVNLIIYIGKSAVGMVYTSLSLFVKGSLRSCSLSSQGLNSVRVHIPGDCTVSTLQDLLYFTIYER